MRRLVYASLVESDEALVARIAVVAGEIWKMLGEFSEVRHSLRLWCEACIFVVVAFSSSFLIPQENPASTIFYVSSFIQPSFLRNSCVHQIFSLYFLSREVTHVYYK
ncbi:hypothetical protein TNCV_2280061 [Trichonephila clavipes]|nr:hypothetical protein TNCV_2280061 [Trichonephila clavipes]